MFMFLAIIAIAYLVLGEVNESEPVEGAVTGSETLMIYLSNFYETLGHKEAVAQVLQSGGALLPVGNYTYEWTITPGGATTSANMWPTNAHRGDVSVNFNTQISSRVELECKVYLNGSLYESLLPPKSPDSSIGNRSVILYLHYLSHRSQLALSNLPS